MANNRIKLWTLADLDRIEAEFAGRIDVEARTIIRLIADLRFWQGIADKALAPRGPSETKGT